MSGTITASPASAFSSVPLSDAERADVRRFCGYSPYGDGQATTFVGDPYARTYRLLELRMVHLAPAEMQNVRYWLSLIYPVEAAVTGAYATLNVAVAGPFTRNASEVRERVGHYGWTRRQLCQVVGVPPGPDLARGGGRLVI